MRERVFVFLLAAAAGLVVVGVSLVDTAAAFVVAGVLLAGLSWLMLGEVGE